MLKKYFLYFTLLCISIYACTDDSSLDEIGPVVQLGAPPTITGPSSSSSFVFTEETEAEVLPNSSNL